MFKILCSFDDREEASGLPLKRFEYIKVVPPLTDREEKAKRWKGRIMKVEDLKEITRMPYHDRLHFIDLVHDTDYVLQSMGRESEEDVQLSPTVRLYLFLILAMLSSVFSQIF
jgi:hypothetical protein